MIVELQVEKTLTKRMKHFQYKQITFTFPVFDLSIIGKAIIIQGLVRLSVTVDIVVAGKLAIDELSFEGKLHSPVLGGSAAHVSLSAATVDSKVAVVSAIGNDFPKEFLQILTNKGINLSGIVRRKGRSSHFWADFSKNGTMKKYRLHFGVGNQLSLRHFSRLAQKAQAIHLGILPPHLQRKLINRIHGSGKLLTMTTIFHQAKTFREKILPQLPFLDILFLNAQEATFLTQTIDIHTAIKNLGELVPLVVITLGPDGCFINHRGKMQHIKSYHAKETDSTGAGDSFAGAFLASYLYNGNIVEAAQWGNAAGALNIQGIGCTRLSNATRQDLEKIIRKAQ